MKKLQTIEYEMLVDILVVRMLVGIVNARGIYLLREKTYQ